MLKDRTLDEDIRRVRGLVDVGAFGAGNGHGLGLATRPKSAGRPCKKGVCRSTMIFMVQTLVALPEDLKAALDRHAPNPPERDEFVAAAIRAYLAWPQPGEDASDLAIINANAAELNAEAEDALAYQIPL